MKSLALVRDKQKCASHYADLRYNLLKIRRFGRYAQTKTPQKHLRRLQFQVMLLPQTGRLELISPDEP